MNQTMAEILNPATVHRDPDFPHAPIDWSPESAHRLAQAEGIDLGDTHWLTIKALQRYFETHERPNVRQLHDALNEAFHASGGLKHLYTLFPGGPVAQGCRLAGLQPPSGSVDKSFGSVQ